jgi:hypothetical protein
VDVQRGAIINYVGLGIKEDSGGNDSVIVAAVPEQRRTATKISLGIPKKINLDLQKNQTIVRCAFELRGKLR